MNNANSSKSHIKNDDSNFTVIIDKASKSFVKDDLINQAIEWRHELHRIPELKCDLPKTHQFICEQLKLLGVEYETGYANTGIVATIYGADVGENILAFRCDMDALAMPDLSGSNWKSIHDGQAHACGHDGHMAMTLAMIKYLVENPYFSGVVKVLFQPSEENGQGAKMMVDDGLFEHHRFDKLFGFHNMPRLEAGTIQLRTGATTGGGECFTLKVKGISGHSSVPDKCINPIYVTTEIVNMWPDCIKSHFDDGVMNVCATTKLHSGSTFNGIPETAEAGGTIRYFEPLVAEKMKKIMFDCAKMICDKYGASFELTYEILCPATINTQAEVEYVANLACDIYGFENVKSNVEASPGGEDMQWFVPNKNTGTCWFMIGTQGTNLHTSEFDFDDTSMKRAIDLLISIVMFNHQIATPVTH